MNCTHPTWTLRDEPGDGGTWLVAICSTCGSEISRSFIPGQ